MGVRKYDGVCPTHFPTRVIGCRHCRQYQRSTGEKLPLVAKERVCDPSPVRLVGAPPGPVFCGLHWPAPKNEAA
jgi:hypothetical protein